MQPPPPTAIAHGEVSLYLCFKFNRPRLKFKSSSRYAASLSPLQPVHLLRPQRRRSVRFVSLLFEANETRTPRLRNFDTEPPHSYCYEFRSDNRLESVANAHTAADLHVRPVSQTALV
jgi:hypothetical protein